MINIFYINFVSTTSIAFQHKIVYRGTLILNRYYWGCDIRSTHRIEQEHEVVNDTSLADNNVTNVDFDELTKLINSTASKYKELK